MKNEIRRIEDYLEFLKQSEGTALNMPSLEKVPDYSDKEKRTKYWRYIHSADLHYFVARVLFLMMVFEYSYFSGFQCIENYLKAYLKYNGESVPQKHSLSELRTLCRSIKNKTQDFIDTEYAYVIVSRFDPYYEIGRYPIQHKRPKNGKAAFLHPDDIFVLDYFLYKMRQILLVPDNTWDIFREGDGGGHSQLLSCMLNYPNFYNIIKWKNINFPAAFTQGASIAPFAG